MTALGASASAHKGGYRPPTSIDATGSSEVASTLETWLNGLPDGATAILPTNGTYLCNRVRTGGTPALALTKSLTILGRGCTIKQTTDPGDTSDLPIVKWTSVSNVTVRDLNLLGARPTNADWNDPWQHGPGFSVWGCSNFLFDNVSVRNVYGDGLYFAGSTGAGGTQSQNCTVQNSSFRHTGRMVVACVHAKFITVDNCTITDPGLSIFDVEPNSTTGNCTDITFKNSTATNTTENASVHLHCLLYVANHENGGLPVQRVTLDNNVTVTEAGAVALPRKIFCAPCWNGDFPTPTCNRGSEPRYSDITITNNTTATNFGNETYAHITNLVRSGNSANTTVLTEDIT